MSQKACLHAGETAARSSVLSAGCIAAISRYATPSLDPSVHLNSTLLAAFSSLTSACCQGPATAESIPLQGRGGKRRFLIAKCSRRTPFGKRHLRCIAASRFPFAVAHLLFLHLACRPPLLCGRCCWRAKQGRQLVSAGVTCFALLDSDTLVSERLCFALHAPQLTCCPLRPLFFG